MSPDLLSGEGCQTDSLKKSPLLLTLVLVAAGCGGSSDTSAPATAVESTTGVAPTPTAAPTTIEALTATAVPTTAAPSTSLKTLINEWDENSDDENSEAATSDQSVVNLPASQLIAPLTDWEVTDYALSYTWQRQNLSLIHI